MTDIFFRLGNIQDVIAGKVSDQTTGRVLHASDFAYGFELGTPKEPQSLGETVIVNGYCFTTSTDPSSPEYHQVISGTKFRAGGLFIIPKGMKPTHQAVFTKKLKLEDIYRNLEQQLAEPFAFAGFFHFVSLHGLALSKAPIEGKNIFENQSEYYAHPEIRRENVLGFVVGVVADEKKISDKILHEEILNVLYRNPLDTKGTLLYHAHVLTFKNSVGKVEDIHPDNVDQCLHLLNEGSTIDSAEVDLFAIQKIKKLPNQQVKNH